MSVRTSEDERDLLFRRTVAPLADTMEAAARAFLRGDRDGHERAVARMARYIGQVLAVCNLLGRRRALLLARASSRAHFADTPAPFVPETVFEEAVADILAREPSLAIGWEAVAELYSAHHGFALAKSCDEKLTRRVQEIVAEGMRTGRRVSAQRAIEDLGGFASAYAENVFRTNAATAYTAGTMEQAAQPEVAEVMRAFEFSAVNDADTRPNHGAAHGLLAATTDPIWDTYAPPLGYQCRCDLRLVSKYELEREGRVDPRTGTVTRRIPPGFASAGPDRGFRSGNPSRRLAFG